MIIAIDFDGVLVEDKFPTIGEPKYEMVNAVNDLIQSGGHEVILWTCRVGDRLREAEDWCREHRMRFTTVNGNSPNNLAEYRTDPRKVYADVYIDDRGIGYSEELAVSFIKKLL